VFFSGTTVRLEFSEYVNQASFARAFSITPEPSIPPRFRWRKRRVDIRFQESLLDSITYIITLDTELRDMRSVTLKHPITLAFSTGSVIDQGRIQGRVVEPRASNPVSGIGILAYTIHGDSVATTPSYRTLTGEDGTFALSYLREGNYFVVALEDRNRDLQPSPNEPFAPPPHFSIAATPIGTDTGYPWVVTRLDTLAPTLGRVLSLSNQRLRVRFSEDIVLPELDPDTWELTDSLTNERVTIRAIYINPLDARSVYLRTATLKEQAYFLRPDTMVSDSTGNRVSGEKFSFMASARPDTTTVRFEGFLPRDSTAATTITPYIYPRIEITEPLLDVLPEDLLTAVDSTDTPYDVQTQTRDGTTYILSFSPPLSLATVTFSDPGGRDTVYSHVFARASDRLLGSISGIAFPPNPSAVVELYGPESHLPLSEVTDTSGAFVFESLLQGQYRVRAYVDSNGNGRWDGGQLDTYQTPEVITWSAEPIQVRPRWDTALPDTLHITKR